MLLTKRVQRERKYKHTKHMRDQTCAKPYKYAQICARMCARIKHILTWDTLQDDAIFDAWHSKTFCEAAGFENQESASLFDTFF